MCCVVVCYFFFFSSRRRHTRSLCEWSSDVCSSDLVQTGNHLFRYPDGNADLGMREAAAQLPERPAELVDERGDAGREMKRTRVLGDVILKFLLDVAHQPDEFPGTFREARSGGRGNQVLSPAHEKLGVELFGEVVKLETYGARR